MKLSSSGAFPDMPNIPDLPHLRPQNVTADQVLSEVEGLLQSARDRVHQLECCSRLGEQLGHIRSLVVDIRRSTLVLQKLRGLVDDFDGWYGPVQDKLGADQLMLYFRELRNEVEKQGLPGALAELYRADTGEALADVACFEDAHGMAVSGVVREDASVNSGEFTGPRGLRNFRLPDPPTEHDGQPLSDLRFATLAGLALDFLDTHAVKPARARFGA